jgi:hypothetical protein
MKNYGKQKKKARQSLHIKFKSFQKLITTLFFYLSYNESQNKQKSILVIPNYLTNFNTMYRKIRLKSKPKTFQIKNAKDKRLHIPIGILEDKRKSRLLLGIDLSENFLKI